MVWSRTFSRRSGLGSKLALGKAALLSEYAARRRTCLGGQCPGRRHCRIMIAATVATCRHLKLRHGGPGHGPGVYMIIVTVAVSRDVLVNIISVTWRVAASSVPRPGPAGPNSVQAVTFGGVPEPGPLAAPGGGGTTARFTLESSESVEPGGGGGRHGGHPGRMARVTASVTVTLEPSDSAGPCGGRGHNSPQAGDCIRVQYYQHPTVTY